MQYLTKSFIPRVYKFKIDGYITSGLAQSFAKGLQSWPYYPEAIFVTINSGGGSVIHAKNIADILKIYSNRHNIPIITFAEDGCLGSANIILSAGYFSFYTCPFSLIGDFGCTWSSLWLNRTAKKYQIKQEQIKASSNTLKFNPLEELTDQSSAWLSDRTNLLKDDLRSTIILNRGEQLKKAGLTSRQQIEEKLMNQQILSSQKLVNIGYLDGIKTFDKQIKQRFSSSKIRQFSHKQLPSK